MRRYHGNETVEAGIYFNLRELAFRSLDEEGRLPGDAAATWTRVPAVVLLTVAPLVGLLFVMFLPLVGFLMLGMVALRWAGEHAAEALEGTVRVLRPAWQPALSFLGRGRRKAAAERLRPAAPDAWADEVRAEVAPEGEPAAAALDADPEEELL